MDVNRLVSFGPWQLKGVARAQLSRRLRQALPFPALGRAWVRYDKPAIALDPSGDQKLPLPCCEPATFGTVPALKQDMGQHSCYPLSKSANRESAPGQANLKARNGVWEAWVNATL